jgi:hypothetical protein
MSEVENTNDVIGTCSECKSDQPDSYMFKSPFARDGLPVPCKYCGGVVIILYREQRDSALKQSDRSRGIS